ncbi:MAG: hypothetical protein ACLFNS_04345 [Desulfobacterales bacterium]
MGARLRKKRRRAEADCIRIPGVPGDEFTGPLFEAPDENDIFIVETVKG